MSRPRSNKEFALMLNPGHFRLPRATNTIHESKPPSQENKITAWVACHDESIPDPTTQPPSLDPHTTAISTETHTMATSDNTFGPFYVINEREGTVLHSTPNYEDACTAREEMLADGGLSADDLLVVDHSGEEL